MANPHKGDVELKAGDGVYVLRYSIDAICSIEDELDQGFPAIAVDLSNPGKVRLSTIRHVLLAGLREHHPDVTLKQAGELIVAAGGAVQVLGRIAEAFALAFPETEASGKKSPRQRANGRHPTGSPS
jgi:hypothetical protein